MVLVVDYGFVAKNQLPLRLQVRAIKVAVEVGFTILGVKVIRPSTPCLGMYVS
jgi:hypothetical protein